MFWQFSYALSKATFACSTPLVIMSYRPGLARCITIAGRLAAAPVAPESHPHQIFKAVGQSVKMITHRGLQVKVAAHQIAAPARSIPSFCMLLRVANCEITEPPPSV